MPTRNVVLTEHHEHVIEAFVRSGRYQDASEVLREGLRLMEEREAQDVARLAALQDAARVGFADLDQRRFRDLRDDDLEDFMEELGRRASDRVRASGQ